jgi:Zn ribbon nucleic-acid-binding protein
VSNEKKFKLGLVSPSAMVIICPKCEHRDDPMDAWIGEDNTFYETYQCTECGHIYSEDEALAVRRDEKIKVEFYCHQHGGTIGWKLLASNQIEQMALGDRVMFEGIGYMFTIKSFAINPPHPEGRIDLDLLFNPPPKPKFLITLDRKK